MQGRKPENRLIQNTSTNIEMTFSDFWVISHSVEHAIDVDDEIFQDVQLFCEKVRYDKPDLINLGLKKANFEQMMDILMSLFIPISP